MRTSPAGIDPASLRAGDALPATRLADSAQLDWTGVLARVYADEPEVAPFTTQHTADALVVLNLTGTAQMASRSGATWRTARYAPGSLGVTAPGVASTLRWKAESGSSLRSLHVHLGRSRLEEAGAGLGRRDPAERIPDALVLRDALAVALVRELGRALSRRAAPLHAETLAQALVVHLVAGLADGGRRGGPPAGALAPAQVRLAVEHMRSHLDAQIGLDELAAVAHASVSHFARGFRIATGRTPHRHLTALRMEHAAQLLAGTRLLVADVARRCGYASPSQFSAAFRRHHGATPSRYRWELATG